VDTGFWWRNLRKRDHLEDPGIDERLILRWISGSVIVDIDWIVLSQNRDRWRAVVNEVTNFWVP
jgi:hypothetical protein